MRQPFTGARGQCSRTSSRKLADCTSAESAWSCLLGFRKQALPTSTFQPVTRYVTNCIWVLCFCILHEVDPLECACVRLNH